MILTEERIWHNKFKRNSSSYMDDANSEKLVLAQNDVVFCSKFGSPLVDGEALNVHFPI